MLSPNAETVLGKRYYRKDDNGTVLEDAAAMFRRVADDLAEGDSAKSDAFVQVMYRENPVVKDGAWLVDFLPNSPTLSNAGTDLCKSACFVLPLADDLGQIMDAAKYQALIQQAGGGTGFDFSILREMGARVRSTKGVASGAVSFLMMFNAVTEVIKQGGTRRGANMAILRVDHPEILAFISCKDDLTKITNFNISIAITNEFMKAVKAGTDYSIVSPVSGLEVARFDALTVFRDIVNHAHATGEPGLVFIDRMNEYCPVPWMGQYAATNPCFVASTVISSPEGDITIGDLAARYAEYPVYAFDKSIDRTLVKMGRNPRKTGTQVPVMTLTLDNGRTVTATPNHKFWARAKANDSWELGSWVELKDLTPGMSLTPFSAHVNPKGHQRIATGAFHEGAHRLYAEFLTGRSLAPGEDVHHKNGNRLDQRASNLEIMDHGKHSREHKLGEGNPNWSDVTPEQLIAFGRDVYDIVGPDMTFRDYSAATTGGAEGYGVKKVLTVFDTWSNFKSHVVGNCKVVSVVDAGIEDVYNITVDDVHNYFANGVLVKNCGEQPLIPYESCNLGSINLEQFVIDVEMPDGTTQAVIDWERMKGVIFTSTDLLNGVVNTNSFPLPQLKETSDATRKIGFGVMGFARMLYKLGVRYGSEQAQQIAGQVMSFIDYQSKIRSVELAKLFGSFPAMKGHEGEFLTGYFHKVCDERQFAPNKHPDCDYKKLWYQVAAHGIYNSNTSTVAPTGTLSIIADTSGGCEPVFGLAFKRWQAESHMVDADKLFATAVHTTFDDMEYGAEFSAYVLKSVDAHHGSLRLFLDAYENGVVGDNLDNADMTDGMFARLRRLAEVFVAAHDVTPTEHVLIQAAFQAFNDSAISKTINFPAWATPDDVEAAYLLAWETGCKGITVYRNDCRKDQPLTVAGGAEDAPAELTAVVAATGAEECPECKAPTLNMAEGCESCPCGYSACSVG